MLKRLLLVLVAVYTGDYLLVNGQLSEGEECTTSKGPGICQLLNQQCKIVYDALLYGKKPEVICGYKGPTPIVCCPTGSRQSYKTSTTSRPIWGSFGQTTSRRPVWGFGSQTTPARPVWSTSRPTSAPANNYRPTTTTANYWNNNRQTTTTANYWNNIRQGQGSTTTTNYWNYNRPTTSTTNYWNYNRPTASTTNYWNYNRPTTTTTAKYWNFNRPNSGGNYWDRSSTTTQRSTTTQTINLRQPLDDSSRLAKRMCKEYAKSVYTEIIPPTFGAIQERVNVSLCAIKDKKLIVGGTNAEPKEFPHMVAIGYISGSKIEWMCGGSLVSDRFVLSAAHCIRSQQFGYAEWARLGDLDLYRTDDVAQPQQRRIAERIRHPNYKKPFHYNDIALFKLESPVIFDAFIRPACLDVKGNQAVGQKAVATGWGLTQHEGDSSNVLLKVTLPIENFQKCNNTHSGSYSLPNGIDDKIQFCAGETDKDTCQGDSGGPLATYSTDEECMYDIIGVTSFGSGCGYSAGVYVRVASYLPWLESIIWPSNLG